MNISTFFKILLQSLVMLFLLTGCIEIDTESKPITTPTPIPGWNLFSYEDVEIWLPPNYQEKQPKQEYSAEYADSPFLFAASTKDADKETTLIVGKEFHPEMLTIEEFQEMYENSMSADFQVEDHWIVYTENYPSGFTIAKSFDKDSGWGTHYAYYYFIKSTIYIFAFTTSADEYIPVDPMIEHIMNTALIGMNGYEDPLKPGSIYPIMSVAIISLAVWFIWYRKRRRKNLVIPMDRYKDLLQKDM